MPSCQNTEISFTPDQAYLIGSFHVEPRAAGIGSESLYRWLINGVPRFGGEVGEQLYLPLDQSVAGANTEAPLLSTGVSYVPGRWGQALAMTAGGLLQYARDGNLPLEEGTIEMWISPLKDGSNAVYHADWNPLLTYEAPNGDSMVLMQEAGSGIIYAGGYAQGQWQSAYGPDASVLKWKAGEWHHLAYSYSSSGSFMRLYLDGRCVADSNEGRYRPPSAGGNAFWVGCLWGKPAAFALDGVRISSQALDAAEIKARAARVGTPRANEVWLSVANLSPGDQVVFESTPFDGAVYGYSCASPVLRYDGIPLVNPQPPSMLLATGSTGLLLTVQSTRPTACRYSLNEPRPFAQMTPFDTGANSTQHTVRLRGLNPNPDVVNEVYVRCEVSTNYVMHLRYRSMAQVNPSYPRKFNIWGNGSFYDKSLEEIAKIDLWVGAWFTAEQARELRRLNPNIRFMTWIDAIAVNYEAPEEYYLRDVQGNKVEVWVGCYLLNVTQPEVTDYIARRAYERTLEHDLVYDGCFFDNVMMNQAWRQADIYGNPIAYDADRNGVADDPAAFDAAWQAGVSRELQTYRKLLPNAYMACHSYHTWDKGFTELFNGTSLGFFVPEVIENQRSFGELWDTYQTWQTAAQAPGINMIESAVPSQISYGYGYEPWAVIPTSTLAFARSYYPYFRFGLALTLMGEGYFTHEYGDTWHGNDWWYDELDFDLGFPTSSARRVELASVAQTNLLTNGGFEQGLKSPWISWIDSGSGCTAAFVADTRQKAEGKTSLRMEVRAASGVDWHLGVAQLGRTLTSGAEYEVSFRARCETSRCVNVAMIKGSPDWRNFGLYRRIHIGTNWQTYVVSFQATETTTNAQLQFRAGETTGTLWLDDVRLRPLGPEVLRRDFDHGVVLLNKTRATQVVPVGTGYRRLTGTQAPRHEYILDDRDTSFMASGQVSTVTLDSGEWMATGPYYHNWGSSCRKVSAGSTAGWRLSIPEADTYSISLWWPAAPEAIGWSSKVVAEIISAGRVLASATLDQRSGGDEWHAIGTVALTPEGRATVRLRSSDGRVLVADAIHVCSAARYNDGSVAESVVLQPMDGIVLEKIPSNEHHDRLPELWVLQYFTDPALGNPEADPDHDGFSNYEEYLAGTDPNDAASIFMLDGDAFFLDDRPVLSFPTVTQRVYQLQVSEDLSSGVWSNLQSFRGTGGEMTVTNEFHYAWQLYYRLSIAEE